MGDGIATYESEREKQTLWERCRERSTPLLAMSPRDGGYRVEYEMGPTGRTLQSEAASDAAAVVREAVADFDRRLTCYAGPAEGRIDPIPEQTARRVGSRLADIVRDERRWKPRPNER